jgi:hypothetical protein
MERRAGGSGRSWVVSGASSNLLDGGNAVATQRPQPAEKRNPRHPSETTCLQAKRLPTAKGCKSPSLLVMKMKGSGERPHRLWVGGIPGQTTPVTLATRFRGPTTGGRGRSYRVWVNGWAFGPGAIFESSQRSALAGLSLVSSRSANVLENRPRKGAARGITSPDAEIVEYAASLAYELSRR